jgi:tRNA(Ile)-lysidine synthase
MTLLDRFRAAMTQLAPRRGVAVIAVSGGPDSVALLDLLVATRDAHQLDLIVAHADHGIHPDSPTVAATVARLGASYRLPCEVGQLRLGPGTSETLARQARYTWLTRVAESRGAVAIVTAHHADDQAETILMRLLSGSGPAGLSGMATWNGRIFRPLLGITRDELTDYLQNRKLEAWQDPANSDPRHLRSWIRARVLPGLAERIPEVQANLLRSGRLAERDRAAWDALVETLPGLDPVPEGGGISVAATALVGYDSVLRDAILRAVARRAGLGIGEQRMERVRQLLERGVSGRRVPLGAGWTAELSVGRLRFYRVARSGMPAGDVALTEHAGASERCGWKVTWRREPAPGRHERDAMTAWFSLAALTVRSAQPGEFIRPIRGNGRRALVRCFQDARVPRSRREEWPVFAADGDVVWIPGVCRAEQLVPAEGVEALRVDVAYA